VNIPPYARFNQNAHFACNVAIHANHAAKTERGHHYEKSDGRMQKSGVACSKQHVACRRFGFGPVPTYCILHTACCGRLTSELLTSAVPPCRDR
jgi:hypothetical protein